MEITLFGVKTPSLEKAAYAKNYSCWKCGSQYTDPADYLWHIQIHQ